MLAHTILAGVALLGPTAASSAKASGPEAATPAVTTLYGGMPIAPGFHAFGGVNDNRSHGQVGDNWLSINEAIQLHNNTLFYNQLSAAEQARIQLIPGTGTSTFLSWARFDGSFTPVITIEQDLDVIVNTTYGLFLSSDNGPTTLDFSGPNVTRGMLATTNSLQMRDFVFSGGPYGIDVLQTTIAGQIGFAINDCRFEDHTQFGVRIRSTTADGIGKGYLERCVFDNIPTAMIWDGSATGRTDFFDLVNCRITGAGTGVDVIFGVGGVARHRFDRLIVEATTAGIVMDRPSGADRPAQIFCTHVEARAPTAMVIDGSQFGSTTIEMRMVHAWSTGAPNVALDLGDTLSDIAGLIEDSTFRGAMTVERLSATGPLTLYNLRVDSGNVGFATGAQPLTIDDSRFQNCTVTESASGQVTMTNCCLSASSLTGQNGSPIQCVDSYIATVGAGVINNTPRPQEQLGSLNILPDAPAINSTVTFEADLPNGLFGALLLGFTERLPVANLLSQPLHVYSQVNNTFLVPGILRFQQQYLWTIPNSLGFVGLDLVGTLAVLPDPGVSALPVQIAPGRRFALQ
ncbi:MAG: hypothetical protein NXI31_09375 [bacterium]|nr:hypothetical protein [bacterium]